MRAIDALRELVIALRERHQELSDRDSGGSDVDWHRARTYWRAMLMAKAALESVDEDDTCSICRNHLEPMEVAEEELGVAEHG
jgi:hypothetical protein